MKNFKRLPWRIVLCFIALCSMVSSARAADKACVDAATQALRKLCTAHVGATFDADVTALDGATQPLTFSCEGAKGDNVVSLTFAIKKAKDLTSDWHGVPSNCPDLAYSERAASGVHGENNGNGSTSKPSALHGALHGTPPAPPLATAAVPTEPRTPEEAAKVIHNYRDLLSGKDFGGVAASPSGSATGATEIAAEAVQILGQIVADRASERAYELLKDKLLEVLGCSADKKSTHGFDATCGVLVPLRLQDIAMSRDALLAAIAQDIYTQVVDKYSDKLAEASPALAAVLGASVVPLVAKPGIVADDSTVRAILSAVVSHASSLAPTAAAGQLSEAQRVVAVSVLAYLQCITPNNPADDPAKNLAACDVGANVDKLVGGDVNIIGAAHSLANELVAIGTPTPKGGDIHPRVTHAINTVFQTSCMLLREDTGVQEFACNKPAGDPPKLGSTQDALYFAQPIVVDGYNKQTSAMMAAIFAALKATLDTDSKFAKDPKTLRAFAILEGLVDYASTYFPPESGGTTTPSDDAHDQRTKILESLTEMMTVRTGRQGDGIWSLAGALRAVGGERRRGSHAAFYGPVSLTLGIHFTQLADEDNWCNCGFHLQLDALDLGQYVSFDDKAKVQSPNLADALAPSGTIGIAFGRTMPVVLGLTGGYSPRAIVAQPLDPATPAKRGAYNVGATFGIAVPLFDLN